MRSALDRYVQDVQASQDDQHGSDGVKRRVRDERGKEATRTLEESTQGYRQDQEYGQEDRFQVQQGEQYGRC